MGGEMLRLYVASAAEARSLLQRARSSPQVAERLRRAVAPHLAPDLNPAALDDLFSDGRSRAGEDRTTKWRALEALIAALSWSVGETGPYNRSWLPDFDRQLARGGVPADLRLESLMRLPGIPGLTLEPALTGMATVLPPAAVQRLINSWSTGRAKMTEPDVTDDVLAVARQVPAVASRAAVLGRPAPDLIWVFGGLGPQVEPKRPEHWSDPVRRANFEPDPLVDLPAAELATYGFADGTGGQYGLRWQLANGTVAASWQNAEAFVQWNGRLSPDWGSAFEAAMRATGFPNLPAAAGTRNFLLRFGDPVAGNQVLADIEETARDPQWAPLLELLNGAIAALCGRRVEQSEPERRWLLPLQ